MKFDIPAPLGAAPKFKQALTCARMRRKEKKTRTKIWNIQIFLFLSVRVRFVAPLLSLSLLTLPVDFFPAIVFRRRHEANNRGLERARASERFEKRVLFDPRVESRAMCPPHHHHNHLRTPLTIASVEVARFFPFFRIRLGRLSLLTQKAHIHIHT